MHTALIDNPAPASLSGRIDAERMNDLEAAAAVEALQVEVMQALERTPDCRISSPAFRTQGTVALNEVLDYISEDAQKALIAIVNDCLNNRRLLAHLKAKAWAARVSKEWAEMHSEAA